MPLLLALALFVSLLAGLAALPVDVEVRQVLGGELTASLRLPWARLETNGGGSAKGARDTGTPARAGAAPPKRALGVFLRLVTAARRQGRFTRSELSLQGGVGDPFATALLFGAVWAVAGGLAAPRGAMPRLVTNPDLTGRTPFRVAWEARWRVRPLGLLVAFLAQR